MLPYETLYYADHTDHADHIVFVLVFHFSCRCCRICAKTLGEACGGPGEFSGQCEPPLQCVTQLPIFNGLGICMGMSFWITLKHVAAVLAAAELTILFDSILIYFHVLHRFTLYRCFHTFNISATATK